jgi:hypothetical protein
MGIPEPEPYPNPGESFTAGYGLGWYVSVYRGYKVIRHGGMLSGFSSYIYLFPNQPIGIVVLSSGQTILPGALCKEVADRLLGLKPMDWQRWTLNNFKAALNKWYQNQESKSVSDGRPPTRELKEFSGSYTHPAYGTFTIYPTGSGLVAKREQSEYFFEHYDQDIFISAGKKLVGKKMQFHQDSTGNISKMTIDLQWGIPPIEFEKLASTD